jgi:hypothetical protein
MGGSFGGASGATDTGLSGKTCRAPSLGEMAMPRERFDGLCNLADIAAGIAPHVAA